MVDSVNASSGNAWTSVQCDELLAANSHAAYKFLEDLDYHLNLEISIMINHDLMRCGLFRSLLLGTFTVA